MRRGVTLIELVVAAFLMVLILGAIFDLFIQGRRNFERPRAEASLEEDTLRAVRWLQRDLLETNLQSIRSFPDSAQPTEPPGLSLESPRKGFDNTLAGDPLLDRVIMGNFGVVAWQKFVFYTLVPDPDPVRAAHGLGNLVRRESGVALDSLNQPGQTGLAVEFPGATVPPLASGPAVTGIVPGTTTVLPSSVPAASPFVLGDPKRQRVVSSGVILPNTVVANFTLGNPSGFDVFWVDTSKPGGAGTGTGTGLPSGTKSAFDTNTAAGLAQRGEPVFVDLALMDVSTSTGKTTVSRYRLAVTPRN